jgi:hypothetical protein
MATRGITLAAARLIVEIVVFNRITGYGSGKSLRSPSVIFTNLLLRER